MRSIDRISLKDILTQLSYKKPNEIYVYHKDIQKHDSYALTTFVQKHSKGFQYIGFYGENVFTEHLDIIILRET